MTFWFIGISVVWAVCGYLSAGWRFAYFQREFPSIARETRRRDAIGAAIALLLGPIGIPEVLMETCAKHGRLYPWQVK